MPRPRSLTTDDVAAAALAVIDRAGLGALTMRAVAAELGLATMGLYRYVSDRDELERLVVDRMLAGIDTTCPGRLPWPRQLAVLAERMREATMAHPDAVPLIMTHRAGSPGSRRWAEATLAVLTAAGFTGLARVVALRTLLSYIIGTIQLSHRGSLSGPGTAALAALPPADFPLLSQTAHDARRLSAVQEFRRGLAAVIRGLATTLSTPDQTVTGPAARTGPG